MWIWANQGTSLFIIRVKFDNQIKKIKRNFQNYSDHVSCACEVYKHVINTLSNKKS